MNIVYTALKVFSKNAPHFSRIPESLQKKKPPAFEVQSRKAREKRHCIRYKVANQPFWDWENSNLPELRSAYLCLRTLREFLSPPPTDLTYLLSTAAIKPFNLAICLMTRALPGEGAGLMMDVLLCFLTASTQDFGVSPLWPQDQCRALHVCSGFTLASLKNRQVELLNL